MACSKIFFSADWFYEARYRNARIKSPVEWMTGLQKHLGVTYGTDALFFLQRLFGHTLFYPPNVSGWPAGRAWIDSSSLAYRLKIPEIITKSPPGFDVHVQPDGDVTTPNAKGGLKQLTQPSDLKVYLSTINPSSGDDWVPTLGAYVLGPALGDAHRQRVMQQAKQEGSPTDRLRQVCVLLTSLPEYQLC